MSKKSYFLQWGCPPLTAFMAVPLTSQHPLEKNTCCCVTGSWGLLAKIQDFNNALSAWLEFSEKN
jgi:hypothetical protein